MFNFNKEYIEGRNWLNPLLEISKQEFDEYMQLASNQNKDTLSSIRKNIKTLNEKEQEILEMIDDTYKARQYCSYLDDKIYGDVKRKCPWYLRVKNLLEPKAMLLDESFFHFVDIDEFEDTITTQEKFLNLRKLYIKTYEEFLAQTCLFLREKINNSFDKSYAKRLKAVYYTFLYEVPEVEKKIELNDLNVPNKVYLDSKLWAEYLKVPEDIYYGVVQANIRKECFDNIMDLLKFKNHAFFDILNSIAFDIKLCQIKAGLIYFNREALEELKIFALEKFDDDDYRIVYGYLNDIFKNISKIKSRYYMISYKNKQ